MAGIVCTRKTVGDEPGDVLIHFTIFKSKKVKEVHAWLLVKLNPNSSTQGFVVGGDAKGLDLHPFGDKVAIRPNINSSTRFLVSEE